MASEKKPSIYSDRSTIGSSDELDEYGVWVKSEPQDLSLAGAGRRETAASSLQDFDSDLKDEEFDSGLDSLDLPDLEIPDDSMDISSAGLADNFDTYESDTLEILDDTSLEETSYDDFSIPTDSSEQEESAILDDTFLSEDLEIADEAGFEGSRELSFDSADSTDDADSADDAAFTELSMEAFPDDGPAEISEPEPTRPQAQTDLSTKLLMKIAEELSSIRTELSGLKKEFSSIKTDTPSEDKDKDDAHGGFFNEEEDEKIALTGDELDNILNTADFTEEAGEDATEELDSDFSFLEAEDVTSSGPFQLNEETVPLNDEKTDSIPDFLSDQDDIIGLEDEAVNIEDDKKPEPVQADESGTEFDNIEFESLEVESVEDSEESAEIENIEISFDSGDSVDTFESLEQALDNEPVLDETVLDKTVLDETVLNDDLGSFDETLDTEELRQLRSEGAVPMTPAPDDTTYLEEEPDFDESALDFSDAVIDEPDLSSHIAENPLLEPSVDTLDKISEDLEIEKEAPFGIDTPESIDPLADDGSLDQLIPEGFIFDSDDTPLPFDDDMDIGEVDELDSFEAEPQAEFDGSAKTKTTDAAAREAGLPNNKSDIPQGIKTELKIVLSYMDQLLESLPEDKIEEFAKSEYFDTYKKLFKELGLA